MLVKIGKKDISQYAQLECEKQLKNKLTGISGIEPGLKRPGMKHITDQGGEYEKVIYNDFIDILDEKDISYKKENDLFVAIDLIDELKKDSPPKIIFEGQVKTPNIFAYDLNKFSFSDSRPDIIYITKSEKIDKYVISIIDVKTTTEPSLKHFSEISFYKLVLEQILSENNLNEKYIIASNGYIWPGNNNKYFFVDTFNEYNRSKNSDDPLNDTLRDILISVPFEIYEPFVLNFFNDILPRIDNKDQERILWQFSSKCQFCDFDHICKKESNNNSLISQVPFLSSGQHTLLFENDIKNLNDLVENIEGDTELWQQLVAINRNLKSQEQLVLCRAKSIMDEKITPIEDRKTYLMPKFANLNIFLTLHFDPISGLTFAIGANKEYKDSGIETEKDEIINIVRNANGFDIKYERDEFLKFLSKINSWISDFLQINKDVQGVSQSNLKSIHFYFWSQLEITQLRRMILRHIDDTKIQKELSLLIALYPPDGLNDNPDVFETQPGTVVKDIIKYLFGLPVKYDYTLFNTANVFLKELNTSSNEAYQYMPRRGFYLELSDQIPFERAYEIWTGEIFLPKEFGSNEKYKPYEIEQLMEESIQTRLSALKNIVRSLQWHYKDKLLLNKKKVKRFTTNKRGMEVESINLQMFEKLNHISSDIENKQLRVLPIDEKENRFMSIRGLNLHNNENYINLLKKLQMKEEFYGLNLEEFMVFSYSKDSVESKIKEGDFLVVLSNENDPRNQSLPQLNLEDTLTQLTGKSVNELIYASSSFNLEISNFFNLKLKDLLKVTVAYVSYDIDNLFIILVPNDFYGGINVIKFLNSLGLLDFTKPMILDPIYQDFNQKAYDEIFRTIGKK